MAKRGANSRRPRAGGAARWGGWLGRLAALLALAWAVAASAAAWHYRQEARRLEAEKNDLRLQTVILSEGKSR